MVFDLLLDGLYDIIGQILPPLVSLLLLYPLLDIYDPLPNQLLILVLDLLRDVDGHLQGFALGLDLDDLVSNWHVDLLLLVSDAVPQSVLPLLLFKLQSLHF